MLKQGYDHFEVTHLEPKVDVCEKRYVFGAESTAQFSPAERCPVYRVPERIAAAVRDKQRRDDIESSELINRGTPAAPITTGVDGGMHPTFLAAVRSHGGAGATIRTNSGTIPANASPPSEPTQAAPGSPGNLASTSRPVPAVRSPVLVASAGGADTMGSSSGSLLGSMSEDQDATVGDAIGTSAPKSNIAISGLRPAMPPAGAIAPMPGQNLGPPKRQASTGGQRAREGTTAGLLGGGGADRPSRKLR
jgi:hypothetical protein